jgi:hypothetical protein
MTARRKTRFVVRRGKIGRPLSLSWNLNGRGAKMASVPVPVLLFVSCFLLCLKSTTYRSGRRSP